MNTLEPLKLSIEQIATLTGEGEPTIHRAIKAGHLRTFLVGRRRFARPSDVRAWVDMLQEASDAGRPVVYRPRAADAAAKAVA